MNLSSERHALLISVLKDHIDCLIDQKKFADEREEIEELQADIDDLKQLIKDCGGDNGTHR